MPTKSSRSVVALALLSALAPVAAPAAAADDPIAAERAAIVEVVTAAYVDGIHNFRDPAAIRAGFHPDFEMLILKDGELEKLPIAKWIESIEARNAKEPPPSDGVRTTSAEFPLVEVTGTAAICKVELTRGGELVFTDYLALYKFEEGWRIVGKSFYRHP
jgi:hypothetical protein